MVSGNHDDLATLAVVSSTSGLTLPTHPRAFTASCRRTDDRARMSALSIRARDGGGRRPRRRRRAAQSRRVEPREHLYPAGQASRLHMRLNIWKVTNKIDEPIR